MSTPAILFGPIDKEHLHWLSQFDKQYEYNWRHLLDNNPEAARCEAIVRHVLQQNGCGVEPNETLDGAAKKPDFRCLHAGRRFYVEATCIGSGKAERESRLPADPAMIQDSVVVGDLVRAIFQAVKSKALQCSNTDGPSLVAVSTLHQAASRLCLGESDAELLLTGRTRYRVPIRRGADEPRPESQMVTELRQAVCLRREGPCPAPDRCSVSGLLLGAFGLPEPRVLGVLHPEPARAFDRRCLPKVKFCRLRPGYESGKLATEWV